MGGRPRDGESGGGDVLDGLDGSLAEVRLWSVVRKAEEVEATQGRKTLTGDEEGLAGWWRMDEGAGHAIHDARYGESCRPLWR